MTFYYHLILARKVILFLASAITIPGRYIYPCIELIVPDNSTTVECHPYTDNSIDTVLDQTGAFSLLVSDWNNDDVGDYTISLQCTSGDCLNPDDPNNSDPSDPDNLDNPDNTDNTDNTNVNSNSSEGGEGGEGGTLCFITTMF